MIKIFILKSNWFSIFIRNHFHNFSFESILYICIQKKVPLLSQHVFGGCMCLSFTETASLPLLPLPLSHARIWLASPSLQACRISCTSMFANRPDKATAVRQTQNTNINKQTNPFIHSAPSKHCVHTQPDFRALTQPAVTAPLFAASCIVWFVPSAFL